MRTVKSFHAGHPETEAQEENTEAYDVYETYEIFRVVCPDCARPIALLADEETLPEHAMCPTPWKPFGLTVCRGSGRSVEDAAPEGSADGAQEQDAATLLTLPEGLDWRMQPFSHAGGPGAHPMRVPHGRHPRH
ncbi:hypothetical protein F0L17_02750 [Streptomyces sp. TRM43335]|uniref:Uncharacterized protein n=1 Tax=Streptomyces taklimakanensis TaxID=2569853 RepID=A0A6G2B711_9ACTN|nr:hypothetical protein [Streptomyces taklimakanensis]MTE18065.1 hypothetical protein [Streptomyces taklimakanensis]